MSWNYRLLRERDTDGWLYRVCEVYYDRDGSIDGWCDASPPMGESEEDALWDFSMMAAAFNSPTLEVDGDRLVEVAE